MPYSGTTHSRLSSACSGKSWRQMLTFRRSEETRACREKDVHHGTLKVNVEQEEKGLTSQPPLHRISESELMGGLQFATRWGIRMGSKMETTVSQRRRVDVGTRKTVLCLTDHASPTSEADQGRLHVTLDAGVCICSAMSSRPIQSSV